MEIVPVLFIGLLLVGCLFAGPIALAALASFKGTQRRQNESLREELAALNREVARLKAAAVAAPAATAPTPAPSAVPPPPTVRVQEPPPIVMAPSSQAAPLSVPPSVPPVAAPLPVPPSAPPVAAPPPRSPEPAFADAARRWLDLEEILGTNWLNKIGIVSLVLGVAFFLAYELRELGPAGKILVGMAVSASLLGSGISFERRDNWRLLARAGISGGWALLFFTTYAMYHVPAARVLHSQAEDLFLLLGVGAAMVVHSLQYRSQVTTGMAFLLAFSTVTISQSNVYSLSASGILALGLAIVVWKFAWYELEIFGILAVFLNHWYWVSHIIEPMHGHKHPFPEFLPSAALLVFYWAVFRWSYVVRAIAPDADLEGEQDTVPPETISTVAALLNSFLLLAVLKYQAVHPEWAFYALLALGAAEMILGQLPQSRKRHAPFLILSTIGATLLMAAIPFRYAGMRMGAIWMFEAEALFLAGVFLREVLFRYLGMIAGLATALQMVSYDAASVLGRRWDGADTHPDFRIAATFALAAAIFYCNAHWLPSRRAEVFTGDEEPRYLTYVSYLGAIMLWIAAWILCPEQWTIVAWSALAVALALLYKPLEIAALRVQGNLIAATVLVRLVMVNLEVPEQRWISVGIVILAFYALARYSGLTELLGLDQPASEAYTWAASATLFHLAWLELNPASVVLAWTIAALLLAEWGFAAESFSLRLQALIAFALVFLRVFFVNMNAASEAGEISARVYTVVPVALAFWYGYWRWERASLRWNVQRILGFFGTLTLVALVRFEIPADWVAAVWSIMLIALIWITRLLHRRYFLNQALALSLLILVRAAFYNLYERSYLPPPLWESRWLTVGLPLLLLCAALYMARPLRVSEDLPDAQGKFIRFFGAIGRHPEQVLFFVPLLLLTALLEAQVPSGMVTLVWGVEGLAVFSFALWMRERSYRLAGLALLLLAVGKIVVHDVWRLGPRDRYLTFIALGAALLAVSWLYTRYRDLVRQYL